MSHSFLLFDLDGTISDPKAGITKSVQYSLRSFGINVDNTDDLVNFIGPPLRESYRVYYGFSEREAETAVAKYREYFSEQGIYENTLYMGMDTLLKKLNQTGKQLVLATSKPIVFAERILKHFNIHDLFIFTAGCELDGRRSTKAEVIRYALDNVEAMTVASAIMIGDREHDIIGAKANGMESIGVLYGYGSLRELTEAGASYTAGSIDELSKLLGDGGK